MKKLLGIKRYPIWIRFIPIKEFDKIRDIRFTLWAGMPDDSFYWHVRPDLEMYMHLKTAGLYALRQYIPTQIKEDTTT